MAERPSFTKGDTVFAKMRGCPPQPVLILRRCGKKYYVKFYKTMQTGYVKIKDLSYYLSSKEHWDSLSKKKGFIETIKKIDDAIAQLENDGNTDISNQTKDEPEFKEESNIFPKPTASTQNCDSEDSNHDNESTSEDEGSVSSNGYSDSNSDCEPASEDDSAGACVPQTFRHLPVLSERELKNWVIYGNRVMTKPDFYKSKPVEERSHSEGQFLPVLLPFGKYVCLKLHKTWPLEDFANEYECAIYDCDAACRILTYSDLVIKGELTPEVHPHLFMDNSTISAQEIERDIYLKEFAKKCAKSNYLKTESSLIEYARKVRGWLNLNTDVPKRAMEYLASVLPLYVDEITVINYSHLVDFTHTLWICVGNLEAWSLPPVQSERFIEAAQIARDGANALLRRFKATLGVSSKPDLWKDYLEIVEIFQQECENFPNVEFNNLSAELYSRASILERLESSQDLQDFVNDYSVLGTSSN